MWYNFLVRMLQSKENVIFLFLGPWKHEKTTLKSSILLAELIFFSTGQTAQKK